ncbi:GNAT family N-acetyltransferase [Azospirillum brasilense]|uniref:GNAT family N-acetyltransferase n=1 Tax=Azospirillum brasilense TaxID=192 RepID=UPI001FFEC335|nr:GNAT family N-acetyltransferase [Azospirillum brasilense]
MRTTEATRSSGSSSFTTVFKVIARALSVGIRPVWFVMEAGLIVTARNADGDLVGVARSVTDFAFCCYLSDLAVDRACQGRGIGKELMRRTRAAVGEGVTCLLLSAPKAVTFYEAAGMERHAQAFLFTEKP